MGSLEAAACEEARWGFCSCHTAVNRTGKRIRSDTCTPPHHKGKANLQEKHRHLAKHHSDTHTEIPHSYTQHILPTLTAQNFTKNNKA